MVVFVLLLLCAGTVSATTLTKPPDIGSFWHPLSSNGTYVYANSFLSIDNGEVTDLGMWLREYFAGTHEVKFQVLGSVGNNVSNGPDTSNVLASTGILNPAVDNSLNFFHLIQTRIQWTHFRDY